MILRIDLFNDTLIVNSLEQQSRQVESRKFELQLSLDPVKELNESVFKAAVALSTLPRTYVARGGGSEDNLFLLETLGVGKYCKKYTVILDFSLALDYVLHRLSGCNINNVHKLANYEFMSKCIMNLKFDKLGGYTFSSFFDLDDNLTRYLNNLLSKSATEYTEENTIIQDFILQFYTAITKEVADIKDYCFMYLQRSHVGNFSYRSKSYAASVASSSVEFNEEIELISAEHEAYSIPIRSYLAYEYAKQVGELL